MGVELGDHQLLAISKLKTGSILCGGVGSGKSRTGIAYYYFEECKGRCPVNGDGLYFPMSDPKDLYIITTAKKRDTLEWDGECAAFGLSTKEENPDGIQVVVDSWNNIAKYCNVCNAFFIFDEQRLVGSGAWVKSFYQIAKKNNWIMLTATPGDKWMDYIPVFVANGFYKNRTEFIRRHVVFNRAVKFPLVDRYVECGRLVHLKNSILVNMPFVKPTTPHYEGIQVSYDSKKYFDVVKRRWNPYLDAPIENVSQYTSILRKIVNSSTDRIRKTKEIIDGHPKLIIFYNFDYELEELRQLCRTCNYNYSEWNGHKHMPIPRTSEWVYLVQYTAGAEGWNCIETDTILFYSLNHSYKATIQAMGRVDRMNTPFQDLYYYFLFSSSPVDKRIKDCLMDKRDFNANEFSYEFEAA